MLCYMQVGRITLIEDTGAVSKLNCISKKLKLGYKNGEDADCQNDAYAIL